MLVDTHCHIHDAEFYPDNREEVYEQSRAAGVEMICVGTDVRSSREAIDFALNHEGCYAVIGIHPHESKDNDVADIEQLLKDNLSKTNVAGQRIIVGIGEIGLDYFYEHSPRSVQQRSLRDQLRLSTRYNLPVSFHIRDAFDDFWPIFDEFDRAHGIMHSFTDTQLNLDRGIQRGLAVGINGISTFTKDEIQIQLYREVPLEVIVLETDAPFLTPKPFRGKMNIPAYVELVAQHQAALKGVSPEEVIRISTANAKRVFGI